MSSTNSRSSSVSPDQKRDIFKPRKIVLANLALPTHNNPYFEIGYVKTPERSFVQMKSILKRNNMTPPKIRYPSSNKNLLSGNPSPPATLSRDLSLSREIDRSQKRRLKTPYLIANLPLPSAQRTKEKSGDSYQFSLVNNTTTESPRRPVRIETKPSLVDPLMKVVQNINKLKEAADNDIGSEPSHKKAKLCHETLVLLSSEESKYQNEMKIVVDEVYKSLFCVSETMKARIEIIAPSVLKKMETAQATYFDVAKGLLKILETGQKNVNAKLEEKESKLDNLTRNIRDFEDMKTKLLEDKERLLAEQKTNYEHILQDLNQSVSKTKIEKDALYRELLALKLDVEELQATENLPTAEEYIEHLKTLAAQKLNLQEELTKKSSDLERLKLSYLDLINSYKKSIIKLKFTKEQMTKMEEQIKTLGIENARLAVKANTGFDYLTPRPNIAPLLDYFGVKPNSYQSTKERVELILKVIPRKSSLSPIRK